jgi:hypothetical protein
VSLGVSGMSFFHLRELRTQRNPKNHLMIGNDCR